MKKLIALFGKIESKKKLRHEKITRYDLLMLNARFEQVEMEKKKSQRSSQSSSVSTSKVNFKY